ADKRRIARAAKTSRTATGSRAGFSLAAAGNAAGRRLFSRIRQGPASQSEHTSRDEQAADAAAGRVAPFDPGRADAADRAAEAPQRGLPAQLRDQYERFFGADLSNVELNADDGAARASHALGARAFSVNERIFFGAGQYQPSTAGGRRLLAHEVAHTL